MITTQLLIYSSEFLFYNFPQQNNHGAITDREVSSWQWKRKTTPAAPGPRLGPLFTNFLDPPLLQFSHKKEPYGLAAAKTPHKLHT